MNYTRVHFKHADGEQGQVTVAHDGLFHEETWIRDHPDRVLVSARVLFQGHTQDRPA